jgi:hypothetical protein
MIEKDVGEFHILKQAIVDTDKLYGLPKKWARSHNIDITETESKAKAGLTIKWEGTKNHSDYVKSTYEIELNIDAPVPVELVENGKKVKKTKATVRVDITSVMITDRGKKWEDSDFLKKIEKFHDTFLFKGHTKKHKKEISAWTEDLYQEFKKMLGD